ncbi:hypothetical protein [Mesorhizobium sp. M7A.F.Ca.MR.362.00.0.0]|uniref:hypothetical protein n=1 Tax=Mesorhizobium sp. M7A.F.Ca.MR.362.00.0.0 TaxID=2496779 RepID=UPI0013E3AA03|nr:hypothetical protein [Mesorhizobium sp. M7A.F.Ca.MR.362.00.0.0]
MTITEIDQLARELFKAHDPSGIWAAIDECERLHFRRRAQQRVAADKVESAPTP